MQGVKFAGYIGGEVLTIVGKPATKKGLKRAVALDPSKVRIVATSAFGNEYDGILSDAPNGSYTVVGPDPYKRTWFATIVKRGNGTYAVS